jgi:aldehyde dehydrogenase (NAD+)
MAAPTSGVVPAATEEPIDGTAVVAGLRRTFATGRTRDLGWRVRQLEGIERLLTDREPDIAAAIGADLGRSPHNVWIGDVAGTRAEAAYARKNLSRWVRPRRTGMPLSLRPGKSYYLYEPLGLVLIIGPWNYPVYLTLGPLIAAVAAGNVAVIKPSEHAPATSALLARLVPEYLDPEAVAVVEGDAEVTQLLLAQAPDHAFFTGGTEIGKRVMAAAAQHLTPVTLELGGKSPVLIAADADLDVAAKRVAWVKLLNSGQTCIAPDYVLVDARVRDEFVAKVGAALDTFQRDEPAFQKIVNVRQLDRLRRLLAGHGGRVALGGGVDDAAMAVQPTVVVDPEPDSELMAEEIFGPILPVLSVDSLDEAIAFVNARPKPLAIYVFTDSAHNAQKVVGQTSSGGVVVNHLAMHLLNPQLPFGGVGPSGMGAYHGEWGFQALSHRKSVLDKPARPDPSLIYPPYSTLKQKLLRRLF